MGVYLIKAHHEFPKTESINEIGCCYSWFHPQQFLSFSISKYKMFQAMICPTKCVISWYITLSFVSVAGFLLDANCNIPMSKMMNNMKCNATIFGLTIYGDCATIDKRPMINIMVASTHEPQALLYVMDHKLIISGGGVKDGVGRIINLYTLNSIQKL